MSEIDKEKISKEIQKVLKNSDLETLSRKMVRNQLEEIFKSDLDPMKGFINEEIARIIEEEQEDDNDNGDESESESEEEVRPKKKTKKTESSSIRKKKTKKKAPAKRTKRPPADGNSGRGSAFNKSMVASPELSAFLGVSEISRPQIVKKIWDYIKENNLQDPNDKRSIILDEKLSNIFKRKSFTMFSMNKYIKRHVRKPEELPADGWNSILRDGESSEEDEEKTAEKERKKMEKKEKKARKKEDAKVPRTTGINKPQKLSKELAAWVGCEELSRPQVVQRLWVHIKEHHLQNPDNKREIMCDNILESLLGEKVVTMFSMNKLLGKHFIKE